MQELVQSVFLSPHAKILLCLVIATILKTFAYSQRAKVSSPASKIVRFWLSATSRI